MAAVTALLLSPLVIPYIVFGISLLLFFHSLGLGLSFATSDDRPRRPQRPVHDPRARAAPRPDRHQPRGGGARPRREPAAHVPQHHPAADPACRRLGLPDRADVSFDEYAVASFVAGSQTTFPIYLYGALRFPSRLPEVIAVAVVVMTVSLIVVVAAELGRRHAEGRLGEITQP